MWLESKDLEYLMLRSRARKNIATKKDKQKKETLSILFFLFSLQAFIIQPLFKFTTEDT